MKTTSAFSFFVLLFLAMPTVAAEPERPKATKTFPRGEPPAADQAKLMLWPNGAPLANGSEEADTPWLWLYPAPADKATGTAVVVCPGGGYGGLAIAHEGNEIAKRLNDWGVSAFVLKYRVAPYRHPVPMTDVQRAIRTVRSKAAEWKLDAAKIGVMGFSAGGHLASTAATHFDDGQSDAADPIDRLSCRPDFAILCYPVISFSTEYVHAGSRKNLLGDYARDSFIRSLSNELQVTERTPPTFLFHTGEDKSVPPENSILFYRALRKAGVPAELHIYERGPHGVGLAKDDPVLGTWSERLAGWLKTRGLVP
jgi:acetyl esterase/lipase